MSQGAAGHHHRPQALHFMNNGHARQPELARQLKAQPDTAAAVTLGLQTVLGRAPMKKSRSRSPASSTCRKNPIPTTAANLPCRLRASAVWAQRIYRAMNTLNHLNRRQMLQRAGMGIGSLVGEFAPAGRLGCAKSLAAKNPRLRPGQIGHFALHQGGPSHVDTGLKPELAMTGRRWRVDHYRLLCQRGKADEKPV